MVKLSSGGGTVSLCKCIFGRIGEGMNEDEFREQLKITATIRCNQPNVMAGDLIYHILDIYDDEEVAVKYFGKHKQWWHYTFYSISALFLFYKKGWIELRGIR